VSPAEPGCLTLEACPACGAVESRERFASRDSLLGVPGVFRYVECPACRTVFQNPRVRVEDLPLCYPPGYFTREGNAPWEPTPAPAGSVRDRLRRAIRAAADGVPDASVSPLLRLAGSLLALHPGLRRRARYGLVDGLEPPVGRRGRCLEVGPGAGVDLFCLRSLGWEAFGLEVDPVTAARARETSGCEVRVGTLDTTDYPPGQFDLVYMSHVFEHLPQPARALSRCHDLLAPGGRLALVHPNPWSFTARLYGGSSCVFEPPRHLVLPSVPAMRTLLREAGFAVIRVATTARHAATYVAASRSLRAGQGWDWARPRPPGARDRMIGLVEGLLVLLGFDVGEEVLVRARTPGTAA